MIAVGFIVAFASAFMVVRALLRYVSKHDFVPFAWYRIAVELPARIDGVDLAGSTVLFETNVDNYGEVWIPNVTPAGWHPYPACQWVYTQRIGWYFDDKTAATPKPNHSPSSLSFN